MKARDLRDRTTEDLAELERSLANERFQSKFKNFTNRLDDTSLIRKAKRDLARVKLILAERARGITVVYKSAEEGAPKKPKTRPPKPRAEAEETTAAPSHSEDAAPASKRAKASAKPSTTKKPKAGPAGKAAAKKPKPKSKSTAKGEK